MIALADYINSLKVLDDGLENFIDKFIKSNQILILQKIRTRLYQRGIDGDENALLNYKPSTVLIKRTKNQVTAHTTLRDTGNWYSSMFVTSNNGNILIDSSDSKTQDLIFKYTKAILELTLVEQEEIILNIESSLDTLLNDINVKHFELNL